MKPLTFELDVPDLRAWRAGNTGVEGVWHFDSQRPGRHVLISALVHGNELCGAWAIQGLLEAGLRPDTGQLTLVLANLAAFDRFDAAAHDASRFIDEDMNRQWLAARIAQPSSQERRRIAALLPWVSQAHWLLDLHSMHEPSAPLLLTGMQPRNLALARALAQPVHIVVDAGHQDGVRMRDYGHWGWADAQAPDTRSLLLECGFHGHLSSRAVAQDMCHRFLEVSGIVGRPSLDAQLAHWRLADAAEQWVLRVTGPVVARSHRFRFTQDFQGLECIAKAGTVIGDNDGEAVTTPYDDCVLVMPSLRQARAGVTVVRFAQRERLA